MKIKFYVSTSNSALVVSPTVTDLVTKVTDVGAVPEYAVNGISTGLEISRDLCVFGT